MSLVPDKYTEPHEKLIWLEGYEAGVTRMAEEVIEANKKLKL